MRKPFIWLIASIVLVILALTFAFSINKVTIAAAATALGDKGWSADFSENLAMDSIQQGHVYVTDQNGEKVNPELQFQMGNKKLKVDGLQPGSYILHVDKKAFNRKGYNVLEKDKIEFTVYETIESVKTEADLTAYFENAKNMQYIFHGGMEAEEESASMDAAKSSSASGSADHSTTNVQVEGVDESDIVKTDGNYMYTISDNQQVQIVDVRNPQSMKIASVLKKDENYYPSQLFLQDNLLIVIGDKMFPFEQKKELSKKMLPINNMTTVRIYNVEDRANPKLMREVGAEGYLNNARKADNIMYLITNVYPDIWMKGEIEGDVLRPVVFDSTDEKTSKYMDLQDIAILPGATEPTYTVITAIDLTKPVESRLETKGFLGSSAQLYMNKDHLYLTAPKYDMDFSDRGSKAIIWNPTNMFTQFFKFKLDGASVDYLSTTELKGTVLNQFSMDEYNGHFRVVMTEGNMWDETNPSQNHLYILDGDMKLKGSVEGLAKGERIYSARFMGDKAYMVTFRETDPLFVIDVADPSKPEVLGELKIPGFSNYLHPLGDNHLIGFGYDTVAKKNPSGGDPLIITKGMKISLFDVTDFHNPKEQDTEIIGGQGTYSQIQYDHKALFQHHSRNLFGFPINVYGESEKEFEVNFKGAGALVYEITAEKGIVLKGDLVKDKAPGQQYEEWEKEVQRIIYSGDNLYTIARNGISSYELDSFQEISTLRLK
ncbi:beta-propeller domain-containing protein [Sporosarcina sp. Sa2YVA2]|uniref:Beta-propeller domain-containing protein n=1 Tax=Sporosarcina quadrami TaxID=2762234 RepID=A0ABR8UB99_9BACL|nr:beta-propeller domain-containing protein [Sporosarcina quadrami]MBD7985301.1 beta-propeller domain-containing protein [Sporosarcina quadrami]